MNTAAELRAKADSLEVAAFDFLDKFGRIAGSRRKYKVVQITFIDGEKLRITKADMEREFLHYKFKLRPTRADA